MIVLIGFMGAGKTTVGRALATRLGLPFADTDELIERDAGMPITDIFDTRGEPGFRELEAKVVVERLAGPDAVVALGGGAVSAASVRAVLAGHSVVLLDIPLADALGRIGGDPGRPMLRRPDLPEIFAARATLYREVAALRLPVTGRSTDDLVGLIVSWLADPTAVGLDLEPPQAAE